jgi:hypothetical protein
MDSREGRGAGRSEQARWIEEEELGPRGCEAGQVRGVGGGS